MTRDANNVCHFVVLFMVCVTIKSTIMPTVTFAKCFNKFIMLSSIILSGNMLSGIMLRIIILIGGIVPSGLC